MRLFIQFIKCNNKDTHEDYFKIILRINKITNSLVSCSKILYRMKQEASFQIYDASAGSGKTFTLVKEYLKIILVSPNDDAYKAILAITFTNKAVGEMKTRVLETLIAFSYLLDKPEKVSKRSLDKLAIIEEETGLSKEFISSKANRIVKNIIHNYAFFDILTIDKFTLRVIRSFAQNLNLTATFELFLNTDELLLETVESLLIKAGEEPEITNVLINFSTQKAAEDKSWDITKDIFESGKNIIKENSKEYVARLAHKTLSDYQKIKQNLDKEILDLKSEISQLANTFISFLEFKNIDFNQFSRQTFTGYLFNLIKTNEHDVPEIKFKNPEDVKINAKASFTHETLQPELSIFLEKINKNISRQYLIKGILKNFTPVSLLQLLNAEFKKIQKEKNILSIAEFNELLSSEIQNQPVPFVYEKMGERYQHFFIDEFQDTSEMQWKNLIPLIDNALSSENENKIRGSLLIVGDPKQSIYRWRGGKAEQFIDLIENANPFSNQQKKVVRLKENRRSFSEIISFNNDFFKVIAQCFENETYKNLYLNHSYQELNDKNGGFVSIALLTKEENDAETDELMEGSINEIKQCEKVFHTIQEVTKQGFNFADIVVLTRDNSKGMLVANYLTSKNIKIISSETLLLKNNIDIKVIIELLKYCLNNNNNESKVFWLHYLAKKNIDSINTHDFISQGNSLSTNSELEKWLSNYNIQISFEALRKKPLYECCETLIQSFIKPEIENAYLIHFLDIILERSKYAPLDISSFLSQWDTISKDASIPALEESNAVKISTIHKAKGLEFPIVIYAFADKFTSKKDPIWIDTSKETAMEVSLLEQSKKMIDMGETTQKVYLEHEQQNLLDEINVIYVALTRAVEQLYIIATMHITKNGEASLSYQSKYYINYLKQKNLFNPAKEEYTFGEQKRYSTKNETILKGNIIKKIDEKLSFNTIKIAQREALLWNSKQEKAIAFGVVIHKILSYITHKETVNNAIERAIQEGLITQENKSFITKTINQITFHPELEEFFKKENIIYNERPIIRQDSSSLIPDKVVFNSKKEVFLLDYKTGQKLDKHRNQINAYQEAINEMGFLVVKKVLLYSSETIEIITL